jgi:hypothetical protein
MTETATPPDISLPANAKRPLCSSGRFNFQSANRQMSARRIR